MLVTTLAGILALISAHATPHIASAAELSKDDLKTIATAVAAEHGLNAARFLKTIDCESHWNPRAISKTADFGLVQVHAASHPNISREQMYDPYFSLEWMAGEWEAGHQRAWSCY